MSIVASPLDSRYRIEVSTEVLYLPEQSARHGKLFFVYFISIKNTGTLAAKLQARHWFIEDGDGGNEQVHGEGVIGEFPHLAPGQEYKYNSFVPINQAPGSMRGHYDFVSDDGTLFSADIPEFLLRLPIDPKTLN